MGFWAVQLRAANRTNGLIFQLLLSGQVGILLLIGPSTFKGQYDWPERGRRHLFYFASNQDISLARAPWKFR